MSDSLRADHLPCGEAVAGVIEQVADGKADQRSAHQETCPYCTAALNEMERLWGPVREMAGEEVEVPDTIVGAVMQRVRQLLEAGWLTLTTTRRGITRLSAVVVATIAEVAAEQTPGVHRVGAGLGRAVQAVRRQLAGSEARQTASGTSAVAVGNRDARVDVDVVTEYGQRIPDVTDRVRRNVIDQVKALTDLGSVEVNIHVGDVHTPSDEALRGRPQKNAEPSGHNRF